MKFKERIQNIKKYYYLIIIVILLCSCKKSFIENTNFFPLFHTKLTARNIFPDTLSYLDANNVLHVIYRDTFLRINFDDLMEVPDTAFVIYFVMPGGQITLMPGTPIIKDTLRFFFKNDYFRFREGIVENGEISLDIFHSLDGPLKTIVEVPLAFPPSGSSFIIDDSVGYSQNPSQAFSYSKTLSIANYSMDLRGLKTNSYNTLEIPLQVMIHPNGFPVNVYAGDFINMVIRIKNVKIKKGIGLALTNSIKFDTNYSIGGNLPIEGDKIIIDSIKMNVGIYNYTGLNWSIQFDSLIGIKTNTDEKVIFQSNFIGKKIYISPGVLYGGGILPGFQTMDLSSPPSNSNTFVSIIPDLIKYKGEMITNPNGSLSGGSDFILRGWGFVIYLDVDVPLRLSLKNITLRDTIPFSPPFRYYSPTAGIQIILKLIVENSFSLEIIPQLTFLDINGLITCSIIDLSQVVKPNSTTTLFYNLPQEYLTMIAASSKVLFKVKFNTQNFPNLITISPKEYISVKGIIIIKNKMEI